MTRTQLYRMALFNAERPVVWLAPWPVRKGWAAAWWVLAVLPAAALLGAEALR